MRKLQWKFFGLFLFLLAIGGMAAAYYLLVPGRAPERRPDLVRVPEGLPPAPAGYPTQNAMFLGFALGFVNVIDAFGDVPVPPGVVEVTGVPYAHIEGREQPLQLDLYYPENIGEPVPALLFIHGGGWRAGKRSDYKYYTVRYAQQGYVVATISYRFTQEAPFPACVEDAKCAVRWIRANAERLRVDPNRIAAIGGSAGGYLSMMTGYTPEVEEWNRTGGHEGMSSAVAAVVNLYGPTDLTAPIAQGSGLVSSFLNAAYAEKPDLYRKASPIAHVDPSDPPTLTIHGTLDDIVPVEQADLLVEKFQALDMPYWYDRIDGWPHTLDIIEENNVRCRALMTAFFEEHLGPPPPPAAPAADPPRLLETPEPLPLSVPAAPEEEYAPANSLADTMARATAAAPPCPAGYENSAALSGALEAGAHPMLSGADVVIPDGVAVERDVVYNDAGMALDVYRPETAAAAPALLFIHGGGWEAKGKEYYSYWAARYAGMGYVCVSVEYRTSNEAPYPAAVDDCRDAVRWMRARAGELGLDPGRIAVIGQSAGGHLALLTAYAPGGGADAPVQAVVAYYAPTDLAGEPLRHYDVVRKFLGTAYDEDPDRYRDASPIAHVRPGLPPTLLLHGTIDALVPIRESERLAAALAEAGVPHYLLRLEGWDHSFEVVKAVNAHCMPIQDAFLSASLAPAPAEDMPAMEELAPEEELLTVAP